MHPVLLSLFGLGLFVFSGMATSARQDPAPAANRYIGSAMCKNCHDGAGKGDAYSHWAKSSHAKAYETLAGKAAKEIGAKKGIADPQQSEQCLKCHVTAFGVDKALVRPSLKPEEGISCESCHGPGEAHQKKRMREAMKKDAEPSPVTADEIVVGRKAGTCTRCHNEESPSYKPFCLVERMPHIEHLDPRKNRSDEDLAKLRATCAPDCKICREKKGDKGK